jgi:hypothetical protein
MGRTVTMSTKEIERLEVFAQLKQGLLKKSEVSNILGVSCRHVRRLFSDYKRIGPETLISKKRGRPSNHVLPIGLKALALALIQEEYADFGPTLAHEKLTEVHKLKISLGSVRNIMITNNLWIDKKIKKRRIYQLRERRSREGELIQIDGSPHDWFEGRRKKCSLLLCVDDATGKIMAGYFAPSETIWSYFTLMKKYLGSHGRPIALYSDKHAVFRVNKSEALSGNGITQFGRAMQDLGIKTIFANSPQAKGRIERSNRILQDRLVKELRLNKISTIEEANTFLTTFIEDYNRRFAVVPKETINAHRELLREQNLEHIFTIQESRHLSKNLTFQYNNIIYQICTEREAYALRKATVVVRAKEDDSIEVFYKQQILMVREYHCQEKQGEVIDSKNLNQLMDNLQNLETQTAGRCKYKPSKYHPWKLGRKRLQEKAII